MARNKGGGRHGTVSGRYQVHDEVTGLFMKVDSKEKRVIGTKFTAGPFKSVRIRETVEEAARESFIAASKEAAKKQRERESAKKKAAAKASSKKQAAPKDAPKRRRGRPSGMRSAKGTGNQIDAEEFSRRALAHRAATAHQGR